MKIITTIDEMQKVMKEQKYRYSIGYVPTMGFLHEGHTTLLKKAREENDIVVLSIFVNPLQFGPNEDLKSYPRDFERDQDMASQEGVDYIFYPSVDEMYGHSPSVKVLVQERTDVLCGKSRPGHFDGVATVLTKLFNTILPDRAYFGMKDAQQVAVVHGLVSDFNFPIEIIPVETVREADGLAKSSRNVRLSDEERVEAPVLYKSLLKAKKMIVDGEVDPNNIVKEMVDLITGKTSGKIDYIEIYSYPQLEVLSKLEGEFIIALAVKFEKVRLIDNLVINMNELEETPCFAP